MCVVYCMPFLCEIIMFIIKHILFAENYLLVSCERLSSTFSIRYTINEWKVIFLILKIIKKILCYQFLENFITLEGTFDSLMRSRLFLALLIRLSCLNKPNLTCLNLQSPHHLIIILKRV